MEIHKIISSSVFISISGAFKLYVAYLMAGISPDYILCFASSLVIYATYTLDRALDSDDCTGYYGTHIIFMLIFLSIIISSYIFTSRINIIPVIFPFVVGLSYTKGLKFGKRKFRLKAGFGVKNIIVAFTWSTFIFLIISEYARNPVIILVWFFFFLKSFINTVIYDFRDVESDTIAGIRTIPVVIGKNKSRILLYTLHIILHGVLFITLVYGLFRFYELLLFSFFVGFFYIGVFTIPNLKYRKTLDLFVDGEWILFILILNLQHFQNGEIFSNRIQRGLPPSI